MVLFGEFFSANVIPRLGSSSRALLRTRLVVIAGADPVIAGLTRDLLNTRVVPIVKEMADPCPP